ncbi:hypothetical protein D3C71_1147670 [compost metagenome]
MGAIVGPLGSADKHRPRPRPSQPYPATVCRGAWSSQQAPSNRSASSLRTRLSPAPPRAATRPPREPHLIYAISSPACCRWWPGACWASCCPTSAWLPDCACTCCGCPGRCCWAGCCACRTQHGVPACWPPVPVPCSARCWCRRPRWRDCWPAWVKSRWYWARPRCCCAGAVRRRRWRAIWISPGSCCWHASRCRCAARPGNGW